MGPGALLHLGLLSQPQWHYWRASLQLSDSCACSGPLTLLAWIPSAQLASQPDLRSVLSPWTCLTVTELWLTLLIPTRSCSVDWFHGLPSDLSLLQTDKMIWSLDWTWVPLWVYPAGTQWDWALGGRALALLVMILASITGLKTALAVLYTIFPLAACTTCLW